MLSILTICTDLAGLHSLFMILTILTKMTLTTQLSKMHQDSMAITIKNWIFMRMEDLECTGGNHHFLVLVKAQLSCTNVASVSIPHVIDD